MHSLVTTRPPFLRRIVRDVFLLSVGFALGVSYALVGGSTPEHEGLSFEKPRTENSSTVSAATWTVAPWPFTIERGELTCFGPADDPGVFIVTDTGDTFALNPAAIRMADQAGAMADLDPIWRDDPDLVGAKVNVSPLILIALQLC